MKEDGYVYFARPAFDGAPIKIGWSRNPWSTVHEGMRWTWYQVDVAASVLVPHDSPLWGTRYGSLERLLHDAMAPHRIQREWFMPAGKVMEAVQMAAGQVTAGDMAQWAVSLLRISDRSDWERFGA